MAAKFSLTLAPICLLITAGIFVAISAEPISTITHVQNPALLEFHDFAANFKTELAKIKFSNEEASVPIIHEQRHCKYIEELVSQIDKEVNIILLSAKHEGNGKKAEEAWTKLEEEIEKFWLTERSSRRQLISRQVFVYGLPDDFTVEELREKCAKFTTSGKVSAVIKLDAKSQKRVGIVNFPSVTSAQKAIKGLAIGIGGKVMEEDNYNNEMQKSYTGQYMKLCRQSFEAILRRMSPTSAPAELQRRKQ